MKWIQNIWSVLGLVAIVSVLVILGLKVFWNFGTAYVLLRRSRQRLPGQAPVSISINPMLDFLLLVVALLVSLATRQDGIFRPSQIALYGTASLLASYVHLFLVGFLFGRHSNREHS